MVLKWIDLLLLSKSMKLYVLMALLAFPLLLQVLIMLYALNLLPKICKKDRYLFPQTILMTLLSNLHLVKSFSNPPFCWVFMFQVAQLLKRRLYGKLISQSIALLEVPVIVCEFTQILPTLHPRTTSRIPDCCRHSNCPIPYCLFSSGVLSNSSTFPSKTRSSMT